MESCSLALRAAGVCSANLFHFAFRRFCTSVSGRLGVCRSACIVKRTVRDTSESSPPTLAALPGASCQGRYRVACRPRFWSLPKSRKGFGQFRRSLIHLGSGKQCTCNAFRRMCKSLTPSSLCSSIFSHSACTCSR